MCCCIIWNVLKFINVASASYWPPWFPKLGWRVHPKMTALDAFGCKGSKNLAKCKTNFKLSVVDSWNHISIFNLSTLELDNALQRLSFAGFTVLILQRSGCKPYMVQQIGCKLGAILKCEKKKSPVSRWPTGLFLMRFRMGLNQRPPD